MRPFTSRLAVLAVATAFAAAPAVAPAAAPTAIAAKSCSSTYTRAVIGGVHKCLRVGQFCAHRYDRQYHRYGFNCRKRDARGNYHLTYR
jgi:hypothetical protein